ncbi:amidase family protein [Amycolatopsis rifamycinica]|uniref:Indole acetimide hydrolase n=1 Tax=Amycolatopsis rifamycinica TaxID=287986 RepID=A0A066UCF5_9PSEU|nr:amidase family protein [Amycolatopsis rifamycinica]KDN21809.1 indole acetimide hydrolase [Amycolatopsis rifamycinica]
MADENLAGLGVAAAAAAIRDGGTTSESYTSALLRRARENAGLHSFITIDESAVLEAAGAADKARAAGSVAPLLGVPFGVKDSYATRGLRTTLGVGTLAEFEPREDAVVVRAVKNAGGLVFGKNNLVEMSFGLTGSNRRYGQVRNPYAHDRVPGGSSSGSAAAVAARIVPAAFGGDTVGSIRVPASLCGVVGFKPTTGRWPGHGVAPISHTLDTTGILARDVEDVALIDRIVTNEIGPPAADRTDLKGARFAYAPRQYLELVAPETEARFGEALRQLRDAGAEVAEIDLGEDFSVLADRTTWNILFRETRDAVAKFLLDNGFPVSFEEIHDGLEPELREVWDHLVLPTGPGHLAPEDYAATLSADRPELRRRFGEVFGRGFDALVLPTTPCPAPLIDRQAKFTVAGEEVTELFLAKNTVPASGAGLPGISIPLGLTGNGLPIGIEFDGAPGHDRALLDLARRAQAVFGPLPAPA